MSYEIGQQFKKHNAEGTPAHILAHAILGAAVAAAGDNNALAGALSAGGAEAAAPYISKWLYGKDKGSDLTAEEKETVTAITNLLGTATGAAVGNSATDAAQGSLNAQSAVGNNQLTYQEALLFDDELNACLKQSNSKQCINNIVQKYQAISDSRLAASVAACTDISRHQECRNIRTQHIADSKLLHNLWQNEEIGKVDDWYRLFDKTYVQADLSLQSYNLETAAKYWIQSGNAKPLTEWMKDQGYTLISGVSPHFIRLPKGSIKNVGNSGQTQKTMSPSTRAVPQGKPYLTESSKPIDGTTVKLNGDLQTQIGKLPKGTVVTVSGNTFKATLPDGSVRRGQSSKLAVQKTLPSPLPLIFASQISIQKQTRHLKGSAPSGKSYLNSAQDAQKVLDAYNNGNAVLISRSYNKNSIVIRVDSVTGIYVNINNPNGLPDIIKPTNIFMIDSTKSPKIVPVNPDKGL